MNQVRLMPHCLESECGIISDILARGSDSLDKISTQISSDSFWDKKNRVIFESACDLWKASKPVDTEMVINNLEASGMMERAGGRSYIFSVSGSFPTESHVNHYLDQLSLKQRLRKLLDIAGGVLENAWNVQDASEYISNIERQFYSLAEDRQDKNLLESSHEEVMELLEKLESGEGMGGIKTGISAIDDSILGVMPGMMDVYAGEASCGKSSLVEMIALKLLEHEMPVLVFQRDMTPSGFYFRLACRMAGVTVSALRANYARMKNEIQQVKVHAMKLKKTPLKLHSPDGCTGADVRSIARRESRRSGIKLVMIDHVRNLRHSKETSWDGLEENSGYIRQSTNDTGIPHIVLAHINRTGAQSDRPTMSHIKGGDQLKDDADNCCVMWLPEGKPKFGDGQHIWPVNFGFDKCRWDGSSLQQMNYNGPKMRFESLNK